MPSAPFAALARTPAPHLDHFALAMVAEFRPVQSAPVIGALDGFGAELAAAVPVGAGPGEQARALGDVLGGRHGFAGTEGSYDDPEMSMLDAVVASRRGLPILLAVVYAESARRAGWPVWGVGMAGHFVIGHFGAFPALLVDPFRGGTAMPGVLAAEPPRPWSSQAILRRMLSNLVAAHLRRFDIGQAIRAAELRDLLPGEREVQGEHHRELRALRARLN
jgi:regulator of sirC expression with transglutaminase-like and TPR domain